ncbi:anaerobic benzoate catabolism transcriptional regulator [compost metagenome]
MTSRNLRLFGLHLAWLRKQRGWSQETLSLESGLARSYLSGIEGGKRNVALINICTLAETLAIPPSEILDFSRHEGSFRPPVSYVRPPAAKGGGADDTER